jgi:serine/threonine protein phosphatase PrpC
MRFSLLEHPNLYGTQKENEILYARPYTGDLFAFRHEEMAHREPEKALWHHRIAKLERMPILGWLAAKMERLFVYLFAASNDHQKMHRNFNEALKDHAGPNVASAKEIATVSKTPFQIQSSVAEDQGQRGSMEDTHILKGSGAAVFDGHLGNDVAELAKRHLPFFQNEALPRIQARRNFTWLQDDIEKNHLLDREGATACQVQIYEKARTVVTSTLGDTHAFIYRRINGTLKAIPLSPKRDWKHPKELARAQSIDPKFIPKAEAKPRFNGLQISRSLGDAGATDEDDRQFISHKPKVTETAIQVNDLIVIATDGLWDNTSHQKIIQALDPQPENPAQTILDILKPFPRTQDNVTVVALHLKPVV